MTKNSLLVSTFLIWKAKAPTLALVVACITVTLVSIEFIVLFDDASEQTASTQHPMQIDEQFEYQRATSRQSTREVTKGGFVTNLLRPSGRYLVDPTKPPHGYPWHRWQGGINSGKMVTILALLGKHQYPKIGVDVLVEDMVLGKNKPDYYEFVNDTSHIRLSLLPNQAKVYLIRDGQLWVEGGVVKGGWKHPDWATIATRSLQLAHENVERFPMFKLITEGDFPIIFDVFDYPWCGDDKVPIFRLNAIADPESCQYSWPTMSNLYLIQKDNVKLLHQPLDWYRTMVRWDKLYPWNKKKSSAVWRGKLTGVRRSGEQLLRAKFVKYALNFRDKMDVKLVKSNVDRKSMKEEDFMNYKAIIDIDGNAWSARLGKILCFNSVIIKVEPEFVNYWEKELQPWVHYIPARRDFSDLEEAVDFALSEDNVEQVQQIIRNAQTWCMTKNTWDQYATDLLWTLVAYAELMRNSRFYERWRRNSDSYFLPVQNMKPVGKINSLS